MVTLSLNRIFGFIQERCARYGAMVIVTGLITFAFDLMMALSLQRFLMATNLINADGTPPLGLALLTPTIEALILVTISLLRAGSIWINSFATGLCNTAFEVDKRKEIIIWAVASGREPIGRVMTLFNDITIGSAATVSNIFYVLSRFVLLIGLLTVMVSYSVQLTLLVLLIIVVVAPTQRLIDRIISKNSVIIQQSLARSIDGLTAAIKNGLFIILHDLVKLETDRLQKTVSDYGSASNRYFALSAVRAVIPQTVGLMAVCLIALYGNHAFTNNHANFVSYLYLVLRLFQMLSDIARVSGNMRLNWPRLKLLWQWWNEARPDLTINLPAQRKTLGDILTGATGAGWDARNLTFIWPDKSATAILNLTFSISPGSLTLITGPSGTGKTTLMFLLLGLLSPSNGKLQYQYKTNLLKPLEGRLPLRVSYVGNDPFLVAGTIRDQLIVGVDPLPDDTTMMAALQAAQCDFMATLPQGLDHMISEQGIGLSAGQKQRLALARALLRKPSVLLLDEATANLDPDTEEAVLNTIQALKGSTTIIVISHRPHAALKPDHIINLAAQSS
jgi:ABC-type multidrug transport system fused ATPase/permease subunit